MEEKLTIRDYKLDEGFLKNLAREKDTSDKKLNVLVQVIRIHRRVGDWNSYGITDGELTTSRCVFVSKQTRPQCFSILKIRKISNLHLDPTVVGEIEFDVVICGERIGYSLCRDYKYINMEEIRAQPFYSAKVSDLFKIDTSSEITVKFMWENRTEKLCSVKFTFSDEQNSLLLAHKSVLMSVSGVFKTHFDNDRFVDSDTVPIVDTNYYYFNKFLEFVYLGKVQFTTVNVAFELLYLSKKYLMPKLEQVCQDVIRDYCAFESRNLLEAYIDNTKTKDDAIRRYIEDRISRGTIIRDIINSLDFLNCDIDLIEWIFSLEDLEVDEWSLLCALYKWACHNGVNARCQRVEDEKDLPWDCLHRLLECIHFENIDLVSLERFFKLPKLPEIVVVSDFKQYVFDCLLEDGSYFDNMLLGTKSYANYRDDTIFTGFLIYTEIQIEYGKETLMKNVHLKHGPVFGFKVKVEQKDTTAGEHTVDIFISFQYLYTENGEDKPDYFSLSASIVEFSSFRNESDEVKASFDGELKVGELAILKLQVPDCRRFISNKIEDFGIDDSKMGKVCGLEISCWHN